MASFARCRVCPPTIASILADDAVSIDSVVQRAADGRAQLVIVTHPAREGSARHAIARIADLDVCEGTPVVLRVLSAG